MLKHSKLFYDSDEDKVLDSGKKYYISKENILSSQEYSFNSNLLNKNLRLKFTIFGLKENENVKLYFNDEKSYDLSNKSLEINYEYKNHSSKIFYFKCNGNINHKIIVEVIVGFTEEELNNNYEIKDLVNLSILSEIASPLKRGLFPKRSKYLIVLEKILFLMIKKE